MRKIENPCATCTSECDARSAAICRCNHQNLDISHPGHWEGGIHVPHGCVLILGKVHLL